MEQLDKHWATSAVYGISFSNRLATGETLASGQAMSVVDALDGSAAGDITIGSVTISGSSIVATISGGKCLAQKGESSWRCRYLILGIVTTSTGERETECVELNVYSCESQSSVYAP